MRRYEGCRLRWTPPTSKSSYLIPAIMCAKNKIIQANGKWQTKLFATVLLIFDVDWALCVPVREIAELHRANAAKDSQAQEVAVSAEMQAREELRLTMERENQRYRQEKEGLIMQVSTQLFIYLKFLLI